MSDQDLSEDMVTEGLDYPPLLNAVVPTLILVLSVAYAWSLRDVPNPDMNLLLLRPLLVITWILLGVVILRDVVPSIRLHGRWLMDASRHRFGWGDLLSPGTEANAALVVAATFGLALFGPGDGPIVYIVSVFAYLLVTGYILNDRHIGKLALQAALGTAGLYLVMGVALGVRL